MLVLFWLLPWAGAACLEAHPAGPIRSLSAMLRQFLPLPMLLPRRMWQLVSGGALAMVGGCRNSALVPGTFPGCKRPLCCSLLYPCGRLVSVGEYQERCACTQCVRPCAFVFGGLPSRRCIREGYRGHGFISPSVYGGKRNKLVDTGSFVHYFRVRFRARLKSSTPTSQLGTLIGQEHRSTLF